MGEFSLKDLEAIIAVRSSASAETSYTKSLLEAGAERIAKKFGEEAVETIIACIQRNRKAVIGESADVLYHLLVLLKEADVRVQDVLDELERRTALSGLQEKANRNG